MLARRLRFVLIGIALAIALLLGLSACSLPQIKAEDRIFLNLSLDYLDTFSLPATDKAGNSVGGLSALAYDRLGDRFYGLADDSNQPRFYTLKLTLPDPATTAPPDLQIQSITQLKNPQGEAFPANTLTPAGLAIAPDQSLWITSAGSANATSPTWLGKFDLKTGVQTAAITLPQILLPAPASETEAPSPQGTLPGLGLGPLTLNPGGDRLFTSTLAPLIQDFDSESQPQQQHQRLFHYLLGEPETILIAEHLYPLDLTPTTITQPKSFPSKTLVALQSIDSGGHFLSLEQSGDPQTGYSGQIFQVATGTAIDIAKLPSLKGDLSGVEPVRKRLLLDLQALHLPLARLTDMEPGPRLPDGSQSLILFSNHHEQPTQPTQPTQLFLFRLQQHAQRVS